MIYCYAYKYIKINSKISIKIPYIFVIQIFEIKLKKEAVKIMGISLCSSTPSERVETQVMEEKPIKFSKITLYWHMIDPNSRAIKALLLAGGVKHSEVYLDVTKDEHKKPEILELNPLGQIPFMTIDSETVVESNAILRMLTRICPELDQYYPSNAFQRAKVDQLLDFKGTSFGLAS